MNLNKFLILIISCLIFVTPVYSTNQAKSPKSKKTKTTAKTKQPAKEAQPKAVYKPQQTSFGRSAIEAAKKGSWNQARDLARDSRTPEIQKLVMWMQFTDPGEDNQILFTEITKFIKTNPNWPLQQTMKTNAEKSINKETNAKDIVNWFNQNEPITRNGMIFMAESLKALYPNNAEADFRARQLIKRAWVEGNFSDSEARQFASEYSGILEPKDHIERTSRLLWDEKIDQARDMSSFLNEDHRLLAKTRIALMKNESGAINLANNVPGNLKSDEGLLYDMAKWMRARKQDENLATIIISLEGRIERPDKWWDLRGPVTRDLMNQQDFNRAFQVISRHQLKEGGDFADAEWLTGWIALRFMKDPDLAYKHFYAMFHNVKMPISVARAAYWAGRAAEAAGHQDIANNWYEEAAKYGMAFYGQLAGLRIGKQDLELVATVVPTEHDVKSVKNNEMVKLFQILINMDENDLAKRFLNAAAASFTTQGELSEFERLASSLKRKEYVVMIAKAATIAGSLPDERGYPVLPGYIMNRIDPKKIEPALVHAIIRQESMFDVDAQSPVGARGLMQLMPDTAREVSRKLGMIYNKEKLTRNPEYNVSLGSHYLAGRINDLNGSYILAIASYNAGIGNVRKWLAASGDPRQTKDIDEVIDWMEMIPFKETRNYVQRVTEALQVYRYILNRENSRRPDSSPANMLSSDITRTN